MSETPEQERHYTEEELITFRQAARELDVSQQTLRMAVRLKTLRVVAGSGTPKDPYKMLKTEFYEWAKKRRPGRPRNEPRHENRGQPVALAAYA